MNFMPPAISTLASEMDTLYKFLLATSLFFFLLLMGGMTYFIFKYRRRSESDKTAYITHNHFFEFLWSFVPLVIFIVVFVWGAVVFMRQRTSPEGAMEIHVLGKQWQWEFTYKNGKTTINELYVPIHKPVKLLMTSADVIHSFFVPTFRAKQDAVPGRYTSMWFEAKEAGVFQVFCAELCGPAHAKMLAQVHVVSDEEFTQWLNNKPAAAESAAGKGGELYKAKGCVACHSLDGTAVVGPTFKGLFGKTEAMQSGESLKVDENYLRESMLNSQAKIVKGFPPSMPTYQGQLTEEEVTQLIEFIKSVQ